MHLVTLDGDAEFTEWLVPAFKEFQADIMNRVVAPPVTVSGRWSATPICEPEAGLGSCLGSIPATQAGRVRAVLKSRFRNASCP